MELPQKITDAIKGRYLGSIATDAAPSLTDICEEFELEPNFTEVIFAQSRREDWEGLRQRAIKQARDALAYQTDAAVGDVISNFKRAMQGALAERLLMYNRYTSVLDAQLFTKLENGLLNTGQQLRLKDSLLAEANAITKAAIEIAKITFGDDEKSKGTEQAQGALKRWNEGGAAIETTGTTIGSGKATAEEKKNIFDKLKEQKPKDGGD